MPGLAMMLKALGVKISPEVLAQIEGLLPQIPSKINALISWNKTALQGFDERLRENERLTREIHDVLCGPKIAPPEQPRS